MNKLVDPFFENSSNLFTYADVSSTLAGTDFSRQGLIKRAIASGKILNIRRGLYCLAPKYQKKPISIYSLAQRIYGPSYISMETALSYHGWIPEAVYACTNASFRTGKEFNTPLGVFSYKRVPQNKFFLGVKRCSDSSNNIFFMANATKALVDYLYIHQLNWKGIKEAVGSLRIDEEELISVERKELQVLLKNYKNGRVKRFLTNWLKEIKS